MRISDWSSDVCSSDLARWISDAVARREESLRRLDPESARDRDRLDVGQFRFWLRLRVLGERAGRSEEHTSELQSLMRISYAVFCLKKKRTPKIKYDYRVSTPRFRT